MRESVHVVRHLSGKVGTAVGDPPPQTVVLGTLPPLHADSLGDRTFAQTHGLRLAYVAGEMAGGIAGTRLVSAMAAADMLGFFGAAGLAPARVDEAVRELQRLGRANWGVNLIHSPSEPAVEQEVAELLLSRGVRRISMSAFMDLTPAVVRCSASGLRLDPSGRITRTTHVFAKLSRPEVAEKFMSPAPARLLGDLVARGLLSQAEADLAARVPVAEDITVEADSGGHTDNRPLVALLPAILALRDTLTRRYGYAQPIRVGAAGGLGTPQSVAAAFAMGAAYVLTGSINQACLEATQSAEVKRMLATADLPDVAMAPSADMFELGVKVQVLRRGTMFAAKANRLYELYRDYPGLDAVPAHALHKLEREILRASVEEVWRETAAFWRTRDPHQLERAGGDPRHRMALLFRWYLGMGSRWAAAGETARRTDYQVWCGPAMGAFNRWAEGTFLAEPGNRSVVQVARNLMEGAAAVTRAQQLRSCGVPVPDSAFAFTPRRIT